MAKRAFTDIRNVIVTFNNIANGAMSPDAYKAAINKVEELECDYLNNPALANLSDVTAVFTGTSRFKLYSFQLTVDFSAGTYAFVYNETVPNAESLS